MEEYHVSRRAYVGYGKREVAVTILTSYIPRKKVVHKTVMRGKIAAVGWVMPSRRLVIDIK